MSSTTSSWIVSISDIKPGGSAILGGNKFAFYSIHYTGILNISISIISCVMVIIHILVDFSKSRSRAGSRNKFDFSQRFPFYLASADFLWGLSHFSEHVYALATEKYPTGWTITLFSGNFYFFIGYQQLMHACLAIYTYQKVVQLRTLELGALEWRLHLFCFSLIGFSTVFFYFLGSFGCSGYWFLDDSTTINGWCLKLWVTTLITFNAVCTTWCYQSIAQKVREQDERRHRTLTGSSSQMDRASCSYALASECLATFVRNAILFYCPFSIVCWVYVTVHLLGFIEPTTAFIIVNIANSSGWGNAWGFFHNENLKRRARLNPQSSVNPSLIS